MATYGAYVTIKFLVKNFVDDIEMEVDPEFDFDKVLKEMLKEEGIFGVAEDEYEVLKIEKFVDIME